ncbi:MAG: hypothetical protein ACOC9P_00785, partial [bacterium]
MDPTNRSNWRGQRTRRLAVRAVVGFACLVSAPFAARAAEPADPEPIATFKIEEVFGVSHPDQVLTFDLDAELPEDGAHLVNGEGETVLFQILAKGTPVQAIAVRSGLPAHASRTWRLLPRAKSAPLPKDAVQVTQIDGAWEISNGRIGLRIARDLLSEPGAPRAVVQGVRLPSGEWAATGPNALHIDGEVTSANIELIEAGPLRVVVEARYELSADTAKGFQCNVVSMDAEADTLRTEGRNYLWRYFVDGKPIRFIRGQPPAPLELDKTYHALSIGDRQSFQISETPGGPPIDLTGKLDGSLRMQRVIDREGFYTQRIRIDAGQSSAFFTEHTDHDLHYELDLYDTVKPNLGRYRGHQARTLEAGRDYEGRRYTNGLHDQDDAFVDLTYDASAKTAGVKGLKRWPYLQQWNPWSADTGWYWMIYNAEDNAWNAPVVGVFSGRASKVRYGGYSGPTVFTYTEQDGQDGGERRAGYRVAINQRAPDTTRGPEVRIQWGLFVGMQSRDMAGPTLTQPINRQMNLFAGINLNKIKTWKLDAPPPAQGFGAMFMPREAVDKTIQRIRADDAGPQGDGYYGRLYSAEPTARDLLDMWADDSGDTARNELAEMKTQARQMLDKLVNGNGIYAKGVGYWHGGLAMSNRVAWIDQMLASKHLGAEQKTAVEQIAAFFGYLLWDNDHVPLFDEAKLNLGTPNMPVQQSSYRCMYALLLARHPDFAERAQQAVSTARRMLHQTVNEHGSQMGSSHYVHAAMGPLLNLLVQIKQTGLAD